MRRLRRPVLALALVALALGLAACGGAERRIIDRALAHPVHDADVSLRVAFSAAGTDLLRLSVTGPFHDNGPDELASFDFRVRFSYTLLGATRRIALRLISTGRNVLVRHAGETYQVGEDRLAKLMGRGAHRRQAPPIASLADLERMGIDLNAWFPDSRVVGEEQLRGEAVTHLAGRLDLSAALDNLGQILEGTALRAKRFAITPEQIGRIDDVLTDPELDAYFADADGTLRRIAGSVGVTVPGLPFLADSRLTGTLDLRDVGERNTIRADTTGPARPIDELLRGLSVELGLAANPAIPAA